MKKFILLLMLFRGCSLGYGQDGAVSVQMRTGWETGNNNFIMSGAFDLSAHNIHLMPEMIINIGDNQPAWFGVKGAYEHEIYKNFSLQAGAGYFFELYSTDKYDSYKNGWQAIPFASVRYKVVFVQYDYANSSQITVGLRTKLSNVIR